VIWIAYVTPVRAQHFDHFHQPESHLEANMEHNCYFAGVGFSNLFLNIGEISSGQLSVADPAAEPVPLDQISYDAAAGSISFHAAHGGWNVTNIAFTGSIIADGAGNVAGFEGTWKGTWLPVVFGQAADTAKPRALRGVGVLPSAAGTWAAVAHGVTN
jgi:hypothetical protein